MTSGTIRFINFVADFKAGFLALGSAGKVIIENSSLKFDAKLANILALTSADAVTIKNSTIEQGTAGDLTTGGDGTHTIALKGLHTNALRLADNTNVIIDNWDTTKANEPNTFYIDSVNGSDVTGQYENSSLPFATLDAAITAYKALTLVEGDANYQPTVIYKILDTNISVHKISQVLFRPYVGSQKPPYVQIYSKGDISIENNSGINFFPLSSDNTNGISSERGNRFDLVCNALNFTGTDLIYLGAYFGVNQPHSVLNIKAGECTFAASTHRISAMASYALTAAARAQFNSHVEFNKVTTNGSTHFNALGTDSVLKIGQIVINTVQTDPLFANILEGAVIEFGEIVASQSFVLFSQTVVEPPILNHGDINGSYAGGAFKYIGIRNIIVNYKDDALITLPCYFERAFNASSKYYLKGNRVEYNHASLTYLFSVNNNGSLDIDYNIGAQINVKHLLLPNRLAEAGRGGSGFRLINCTLEIGDKITEGFTFASDGTAFEGRSALQNRLLEIIGDCTIISGVVEGTSILSNTIQANSLNAECFIKGNLQIISGIIDETEVDVLRPVGTITEYSNRIRKKKVSLTASQINAIGTTNVTAIAAPGVGKAIRIIDFAGRLNFGTVAFDNNALQIEPSSGTGNHQYYISTFINGVANTIKTGTKYDITGNIVENTSMVIDGTDSVAVGDGTVDLYITYEIITL